MTLWSKQPFKSLCGIFFLLKLTVVLSYSLLRYSPKSSRPNGWSLKVCVISALARELFRYDTKTRSSRMASVEAGHKRAKAQFSLAKPAEASLYSGVLTPGAVQPAPVGGLWFPKPISQGTGSEMLDLKKEKVVLHCPGGAFVIAFGTDDNGKLISDVMTQHLNMTKTFVGQYRVATDSHTQFPGALQDLVTLYHYILSLGVSPSNIIISGDSAAGNLAIGLLRYLENVRSPRLPLPRGAMLWSPWVHVTPQAARDYDKYRNSQNDVLVGPLLEWGVDAYIPGSELASDVSPFISPLHHPFKTSVPVFINGGGGEALFDQIKDFAQEMDEVEGNRIRFHATDGAPHDLLLAYKGLGLEHEMETAAKDAYDFFALDE